MAGVSILHNLQHISEAKASPYISATTTSDSLLMHETLTSC